MLGRNEPCHCGSGKKYKKCHLAEDVSAASAKLAEQNATVAAAAAAEAEAEADDADAEEAPKQVVSAKGKRVRKRDGAKGPRSEHTAMQIRRRGIT